jgi:type II secretory pathway pseudopilin PulG
MRRDRGESLVELIVAVAILGVAVVAIVAGLGTSVLMSDVHRKQATAGVAVRDYAEAVENAVVAGGYVTCANADGHDYAAPAGFAVLSGYSRSAVAGPLGQPLAYWNGSGWQTTCPASGDTGLQQLTLQVASSDGRASEKLVLVVRKPCRLTDASCA